MKWYLLILIPLLAGILWWLYENGYVWQQSKSAVTFLGRSGSSSFGASFTACTGNFGRCLKPKEGGTFRFRLSASLSGGSVRGRIYRGKEVLAELNAEHPEVVLPLQGRIRYRLELRFVRAGGSATLTWEAE